MQIYLNRTSTHSTLILPTQLKVVQHDMDFSCPTYNMSWKSEVMTSRQAKVASSCDIKY